MAKLTAHEAMRRALVEAAYGPVVNPNPRVGCVILADSELVGCGRHRGAGTPHAEAAALKIAGPRARGATAYVTLEPCTHNGRTGPCTTALIEAGVKRVVFAAGDPSPQAGGGAKVLREAGIDVCEGLLAAEAEALNPYWSFSARIGRPFVTWKFASTLDGNLAAQDGSSAWVTGAQARADVHLLRAGTGAIAIGTGTVLADDPSLTVRRPDGSQTGSRPLRVVIGKREIPSTAKVLDSSAPSIHLPTHDVLEALRTLGEYGTRHVLLESGPTLAAAFWRAGAIDEVVAYVAPKLLGTGTRVIADLGITTMADAGQLELMDVTRCGDDVRMTLRPEKEAACLPAS